jgi:hypothetical protein
MGLRETQYIVVDRISDEQVHIGLPDTRGGYHQTQITWEQARALHEKLTESLEKNFWVPEQD